jgi:hypothetical protein
MGLTAMRGDASSEAILNAACIDRASHVMVAPSHDDECVLICLTVRTLNPHVRLVAGGREEENIKLLYRAGADVVVAPPVSGGRLMGAAARQSGVTHFLQDLLTFGSGLDASEYKIGPKDAGKTIAQVTQPALFRRQAHPGRDTWRRTLRLFAVGQLDFARGRCHRLHRARRCTVGNHGKVGSTTPDFIHQILGTEDVGQSAH